ncbi:Uma2 family endonuclease [Streptomyces rubradiris]|uniref:Uma2 family endonuclease n=1 Tax=Streptomyces rubradiris TaxID=285531 RepID=UPI0033D5E045
MSAASVEQPMDTDGPLILTAIADEIVERHPGYRVEIIGGHLLVSPTRDARHASVLTELMCLFLAAGLHGEETEVLQSVAIKLPTGTEDYCIPDLVVVDADVHAPGETVTLPDSVGAEVALDVEQIIRAGQKKSD